MPAPDDALRTLDAARWRVATILTAAMTAVYLGFILLVAYAKPVLARPLAPGLSVGILLGALVIVVALGLIGVYVRWANRHYDAAVDTLRRGTAVR